MKQLLSKAAILSLALVSPFALANSDRMAQVEQRMEEVRERLNLSDEQIDQMTPVLEESMEKRQAVLSSYGIDPENRANAKGKLGLRKALAMKKELNAIRTDTLRALNDVLTDEQLEEFKLMQAERQSEMRERIRSGSSQRSDFQTPPGFGRGVMRLM
ncbi:MAG: hypothetical protein PVG88_04300 [Methyloceanibacter sp.]|jgi:hypothetical protein